MVQVDGLPILKLKKMALSRDLTMILIWETPAIEDPKYEDNTDTLLEADPE